MDGQAVAVVRPGGAMLKWRIGTADTSGMIDSGLEQFQQNPEWRLVLEAYQAELTAGRQNSADHDGWIGRIVQIDGIEKHRLPFIHGKLIAYGYLKFQLNGRSAGVVYQLSADGKRLLGQIDGDAEAETAGDEFEAEAA